MEKVVLIFEDNHGLIGVANNYYNAVKFLIERAWLDEDTTIYEGIRTKEITEVIGNEWKSFLLNFGDMKKFNEIFEGVFYLAFEDVYDGE